MRSARLKLQPRVDVRGRVHVERGVRVSAAPGARIVLEDGCRLGEGCRIEADGGTVRVGPGARIGERAMLVAVAGIELGSGCDVGSWAIIADADPAFADGPAVTRVGDGARIGMHAAVLAGATVAPGDVVQPYETRAPRRSA